MRRFVRCALDVVGFPLMVATSVWTLGYGAALLMWLGDGPRVVGGVHFPLPGWVLVGLWSALLGCAYVSGQLEKG